MSLAEKNSASTRQDGSYKLAVEDMSCASCVARVEKAILTVDGVIDASVNLVEGTAYVVGGDPEQVAEAVSERGYPSHLAEAVTPTDMLLVFQSPLVESEQLRAIDTLSSFTPKDQIQRNDAQHWRIRTSAHAADALLALRAAGLSAGIVEDTDDPYRVQERQTHHYILRAVRRAALAAGVGFGLMFAMHLDALP